MLKSDSSGPISDEDSSLYCWHLDLQYSTIMSKPDGVIDFWVARMTNGSVIAWWRDLMDWLANGFFWLVDGSWTTVGQQLDHSWTTVGQHVLICFVCILRDWWSSLGDHEGYMALESTMEDTPKNQDQDRGSPLWRPHDPHQTSNKPWKP